MLSACAVQRSSPVNNMDLAEEAISRQEWETAYRFLEDGFVDVLPDVKAKALNTLGKYPQLLTAGANTFSRENISETLIVTGQSYGEDIVLNRLERFKVVASQEAYQIAKSNFDSVAIVIAAQLKEKRLRADEALAEERRREKELRDEKERKKNQTVLALIDASKQSRVFCQSRAECEKAFSLTQIYMSEKSDMKIQVATEAIIETFNPTDSMKIGLKAIKIPKQGDTAEIVLTVSCRDESRESFKEVCDGKLLSIYTGYPAFVRSMLRP